MTDITQFRLKLYPKDFSAVRDFYERTLGFAVINEWDRGEDDKGVMFQVGPAILEVQTLEKEYKPIAGADISLAVSNVHSLWEELKDKTDIVFPLRDNDWGDTSFCIRDPEGFGVTFFTNNPDRQQVNEIMTKEEWEQSITRIGIVAGCVIKQDDKYLLIQEKQPKVYGLWNLPAGYVDKDEEIEQAAIREAKEETGYDVKLDGPIGLYHETTKESLKHVFKAHIVGGELKIPEDEILDAKWLTYDEVKKLHDESKLRADLIFDAIDKVEAKG